MIAPVRLLAAALLAAVFATAPVHGSGGGDHGSKKKSTGSETFVELPIMTATVIEDFEPRGLFEVEIGLEVPDAHLRERAMILEPRLRSACSEALRVYAGDEYIVDTSPDADRILELMQAAVDETLGQPGAQVLFGMLVIQSGRR